MSAYEPASAVGWLDFDAASGERVATLLRAMEEPGTLDPLGFGAVRDGFSAMLSPGTSTIQTRLRYFVFLPWIFADLQSRRVPPGEFDRRLLDSEARLIDCLRPLGPNQGVIGYTVGRDLKRMPSEVYWGGLGSWGIRRLDLSLADYGKRAAALGRLRPDRDDDGNVVAPALAMWSTMPPPPDDWLAAGLNCTLAAGEAQVIVDHLRQRHPASLLAIMCAAPQLAAGTNFPWDVPARLLPPALATAVEHARCFSELTIGPQHVYNVLIARRAHAEFGWDTAEFESRETDQLADWAALITSRDAELRAWVDDLPAFWALIGLNSELSERTRDFVRVTVARALDDPSAYVNDPTIHTAIRHREIQLKGTRARLGPRTALENWNQTPFGGQLDYRWPITRSYLADLAAAAI